MLSFIRAKISILVYIGLIDIKKGYKYIEATKIILFKLFAYKVSLYTILRLYNKEVKYIK